VLLTHLSLKQYAILTNMSRCKQQFIAQRKQETLEAGKKIHSRRWSRRNSSILQSRGATLQQGSLPLPSLHERKEWKNIENAFRRQFDAKPSIIMGCPGPGLHA